MASEFMGIKPPSQENPVVLFNDVPTIGSFLATVPLSDFLDRIAQPNPQIPNVLEVPDEEMRFKEWRKSDAKRLKLPLDLLQLPAAQLDLLLAQFKTIQDE